MSVSPNNLANLPRDCQVNIMRYCSVRDILRFEGTTRPAHLMISNIWLILTTERNLFFGATNNLKTNLMRVYSFFSAQNVTTDETFIKNPMRYVTYPGQRFKESILKLNRHVLITLLPNVNKQLPIPFGTQLSTCHPDPFLSERSQNTPYKRIFLQITLLDNYVIATPALEKISPRKITSIHHFAAAAFLMFEFSLTKNFAELFSLLENYRFSLATDTSNKFHAVQPYIYEINFLILNEIRRTRPPILEHLLAIFSTDRPKILLTNKTLSRFEEEDKKVCEEDQLFQKAINSKFDNAVFKEWPFTIQPPYNDKTPLHFSIIQAHEESQKFFEAHRKKLDPRENPNLDLVKILIAAKANVNEPGIMSLVATQIHDLDILNVLIEGKADVNQREGGQPLLERVIRQRLGNQLLKTHDILLALINAKADINARNELLQTPLMIAAEQYGNDTFQLFLQQGPDRLLRDFAGNTALMYALRMPGNGKKITLLISSQVLGGAPGGRKRVVRMSEEDINQKNILGQRALSHAILHNHSGTESYVKHLLKAGADPKLIPPGMNIPAHIAALFPPQEPDTAGKKGAKRKSEES